ncbi:MAG TPA: tripartite tricarboxylate transporter substrate binding protein [Burkholderiales bacterium]|nr:tripartite tricarboxylate transporter substrate binding protein [Burkholderiales bacterium]
MVTRVFMVVGLVMLSALAGAQSGYPEKPIRIVSPFAAGGTNDYLARVVGRLLSEKWGQTVVVENRAGAGGNIGMEAVARAAPDGYTLLMGSVTTHAINPALYSRLPFDARRDFAPVSGVAATQTVLVVHPSMPIKSVNGLIALAKSRPRSLHYGSAGNGSISHMGMELFRYLTGATLTHVPYKGEGQAAVDVMSGQIEAMFPNMPTVLGIVQAGKLRAIAVGGRQRSPLMPGIPTVAESGVPGYEMSGWFGLFSPAGVSGEVLRRINAEVTGGLQRPDIKALLAKQGAEPVPGAVDQFTAFVRGDVVKWAKVVTVLSLKID